MESPRFTTPARLVLRAFADDPDHRHYGYELATATGLASGTIYPLLARLERAGWLEGGWEPLDRGKAGRPPRRYYRLTGDGQLAAEQRLAAFRKEP